MVHIVDGLLKPDFYDIVLYHELALRLNLTAALSWVTTAGFDLFTHTAGSGFTILAPSNEADAQLDPAIRARLMSDPDFRFELLWKHFLSDVVPLDMLLNDPESLGDTGKLLESHADPDGRVSVTVDNYFSARIVLPDQLTREGIIHVIDNIVHFDPWKFNVTFV